MTPEQYADRINRDHCNGDGTDWEELYRAIVATIREAVDAEREACAKCAEDVLYASPADGTDHAQGRHAAAWAIREKIRQRPA